MRSAVSLMRSPTPCPGPVRSPRFSSSRPREAQRARDQRLGALALGLLEPLVRFAGRVAELQQPVAGEPARVRAPAAAGNDRPASGARRLDLDSDLLAQLDDDPLGRTLADPGDGLKACGVARGERCDELARRAAGE